MGLYQHHLEIPKELLKKDYGFSMDFGGFTDIHVLLKCIIAIPVYSDKKVAYSTGSTYYYIFLNIRLQ